MRYAHTAAAAVALGTIGAGLVGVTAAQASDTPACGNTDLKASYRYSDAGAGHRYGWIVLTNVSGHACRTGGFGGLSYVGKGNGTQIGAAADRIGKAYTLVVKPQKTIRSAVDEVVAANFPKKACTPTHVDGFRVYVPNATKSQYVVHPTTGCAKAKVHLLSHHSYRHP
ncbi:DUF4232 domain-containing protein [Nocardioides sp. DS6]|uniref:DUF4232 domain-containing protein n=1 Tax=Nocardioides eburneus TaxID=3231482 RepID=A0ABV3SZ57_9ACTN